MVAVRRICLAVPLVAFHLCVLGQGKPVPDALFGVKLGSTHTLGKTDQRGDIGTLPIKGYTGARRFLGNGIHYFFQPQREYVGFPYSEKREDADAKHFETSFRLYLLPVFPKDVLTAKEFPQERMRWEVAVVEWSDHPKDSSEQKRKDIAYYWAKDLCKTVQVDLEKEPKVVDHYEHRVYDCIFREAHRELKVGSLGGIKLFLLQYPPAILEKKDKAVETIQRKLQIREMRPY